MKNNKNWILHDAACKCSTKPSIYWSERLSTPLNSGIVASFSGSHARAHYLQTENHQTKVPLSRNFEERVVSDQRFKVFSHFCTLEL